MEQQFDTCSYEEVTGCVLSRIEWIRECKAFLADENAKKYSYVRSNTNLKVLLMKAEIQDLLKIRRIMKRNGMKNWDNGLAARNFELTPTERLRYSPQYFKYMDQKHLN